MEMPRDDAEYHQIGSVEIPINDNGQHECTQCGSIWWSTFVVFGRGASVGAVSLDATCARCGFPMMMQEMEEI